MYMLIKIYLPLVIMMAWESTAPASREQHCRIISGGAETRLAARQQWLASMDIRLASNKSADINYDCGLPSGEATNRIARAATADKPALYPSEERQCKQGESGLHSNYKRILTWHKPRQSGLSSIRGGWLSMCHIMNSIIQSSCLPSIRGGMQNLYKGTPQHKRVAHTVIWPDSIFQSHCFACAAFLIQPYTKVYITTCTNAYGNNSNVLLI